VIILRIRDLRNEFGLTQEELGKKIGQTKSNISKYETGSLEPGIDTLRELAKIFNVSLDYLMGESDIRNPYVEMSIKEEYKDEIKALDKFRQIMIDKGFDYENKTCQELADIVAKHIKIQELLNDSNSKSN
jgi:transcriptional regulator with XRE-family HTH domain